MDDFCVPVFNKLSDGRVSDVQDSGALTALLQSCLETSTTVTIPSHAEDAVATSAARQAISTEKVDDRHPFASPISSSRKLSSAVHGTTSPASVASRRSSIASPSSVSRHSTAPSHRVTVLSPAASVIHLSNEHTARFSVSISDFEASTPVTFLQSGVIVDYSVEAPLSRIFTREVIGKYQDVWRLLLQVKYAKFVLDALHRNTRQVEPKLQRALQW